MWLSSSCCIQLGGARAGSSPSKTFMFERSWRPGEVFSAWRQVNDFSSKRERHTHAKKKKKKKKKNTTNKKHKQKTQRNAVWRDSVLAQGKSWCESFWNTLLGMWRRKLVEAASMCLPGMNHTWQTCRSFKYSCIQVRTLWSGEVDKW